MISKIIFHKNKFFVFFLFLFSIIFNQYYGYRGVFPIDGFSHFDNSYRILNGEQPFNDYWIVSGPIVDYIQIIFFHILGVNWHSYVLHASSMNALLTVSTFFVLKNFKLETNYCFLYALLFAILAYPSSGTPFRDHHSAFFSLLGIYSFLLAMHSQKKMHWILMPLFLGLAFLSKQVPAAYIILSIFFILIFYSLKNKKFDCIKYSLFGSVLFIFLVLIFGKFQGIKFSSFLDQYILYPQTIGKDRFQNFSFTFSGVIDHFKFIYLASIPLFYVNFRKIFSNNGYTKHNDFFIFLSLSFFMFCLILHQLITKNQTFIFFLIPILTAFSHISLNKIELKSKRFIYSTIILICIFATFKYHLRFNVDRKFHELANVNFSLSTNANAIDKKLSGLSWITPEFKDQSKEEINFINQIKSHLKSDTRNKMLITNYSFFSAILNQKLFSPSFAYTDDGTTHPLKGNEYFVKYKKLMIDIVKKNNILVIYIAGTLEDKYLYDYIDQNCFEKFSVSKYLNSYELKDCSEING